MVFDYDRITETGGTPLTSEAASMVYTRYSLASDLARGRRTLEIGCASGVGLGLLLRSASMVVGGDLHFPMLREAMNHYGSRVSLAQFSATALPFGAGSFDLVLFLEATYYVREFEQALDEIDRILSGDGVMLFVNANPERPDFIRSPFSEHYHTAGEFRALLEARGYSVETTAAFALHAQREQSFLSKTISWMLPVARRIAEALHLVPRTLKGRARIKRLVFGRLKTLPPELPPDFASREPRKDVDSTPVTEHKVIYIVGRRQRTRSVSNDALFAAAAND